MKNAFWVFAAGVGLAGFMIYENWHAMGSGSWPATDGQIKHGAVTTFEVTKGRRSSKRTETHYRADIVYQYVVDGQKLENDEISPAYNGSVYRSEADSLLRQFPIGTTVKIYYNPSNPSVALLRPGVANSIYYAIAAGLALALLGGGLFVRNLNSR